MRGSCPGELLEIVSGGGGRETWIHALGARPRFTTACRGDPNLALHVTPGGAIGRARAVDLSAKWSTTPRKTGGVSRTALPRPGLARAEGPLMRRPVLAAAALVRAPPSCSQHPIGSDVYDGRRGREGWS